MALTDTFEPDRPRHEVEIRTLAQPDVVEISADCTAEISPGEMLRFLADYLDGVEGVAIMASLHWAAEEDRWILTATIDK